MTDEVTCHSPSGKCTGCDHYHRKAPVCIHKKELTICDVPLSAFAKKPDPYDLAAIFAEWNNFDQMRFMACVVNSLRANCGDFRADVQLRNLGAAIGPPENEHLDESYLITLARHFIKEVYETAFVPPVCSRCQDEMQEAMEANLPRSEL